VQLLEILQILSVTNIDLFFQNQSQLPPATGHCDNCAEIILSI